MFTHSHSAAMAISSVSGPTIKAMVANTTGRRFLSSVTLAGIRTGSIVAPAATIRYYQHISTQNSSLPSSKKNKRDSPQHQQIREFSFSYGSGSNKAKSEAGLIPQAVRNETPEQLMHESHPMPMRDEFMGSKRLTTADLEAIPIDLKFHREPTCFSDRVAYHVVKSMRIPVDLFFRTKYIHRVVALETVAAVPGMVAGMLRHLRSLRRCSHDGGWISHLLHEAENERMHLLTWMKVSQPTLFERALVTTVQGVFFNIFFALYMVSDRTAHRVVGYLEEQAVISYTHMLEEIDTGILADGPAPKIAIDYWNLEETATIRDVCLAIRLDEAVHMHTNHHLSDRIALKQEDLRVDIAKLQEERGMVPNENAEKVWSKPNKY